MRFQDRGHAGRLLAAKLKHLRAANPIVLGLTRSGIEVAFEVARALEAPLDLIVVRKVGLPGSGESAGGAIAEGGVTFLGPAVPQPPDELVAELARRVQLYRAEFPANRLGGRTVIVVDDFAITGATARAAARAARQRGAARVVLAAPVLASEAAAQVGGDYDEVVAVEVLAPAQSALDSYQRLEETTDRAALDFLRRARLEWRTVALPAVT